jgi:hypothetical protein
MRRKTLRHGVFLLFGQYATARLFVLPFNLWRVAVNSAQLHTPLGTRDASSETYTVTLEPRICEDQTVCALFIFPRITHAFVPYSLTVQSILVIIWPTCFDTEMPYNMPHRKNKIPWPQSVSELYRPSDRRFSAKLVSTFLRIDGATWSVWRIPTVVFSAF